MLAVVCCWHWWCYFLSLCCSQSVFFSFQNCQALVSLKIFARCFDYLLLYNKTTQNVVAYDSGIIYLAHELASWVGLGEDGSCLPAAVLLWMASLGLQALLLNGSCVWLARWCWLLSENSALALRKLFRFPCCTVSLGMGFFMFLCASHLSSFLGLWLQGIIQYVNFPTVIS